MKFIILFSLIAITVAVPVDQKTPLSPPLPSPLDNNKPPLNPSLNGKTVIFDPAAPKAPLHKRDTQQAAKAPAVNNQDTKAKTPALSSSPVANTNTKPKRDTVKVNENQKNVPVNNVAQKTVVAPNPVSSNAAKTPSVNRPSRDTPKTQQDSYKPQASGIPQKNNAAPSPVASSDSKVPSSNARPSRDTPKAQAPQVPVNQQKNTAPVIPQKDTPVASTPLKNSRNRRDTPKTQDSYKPQASGIPQKNNAAPSPVASSDSKAPATNARPSRDTPKAPVPVNQQKNTAPVTPQKDTPIAAAAAPSKNSRNRRDTPPAKPVDNNNQKPVEWNKNEKQGNQQQKAPTDNNRKTRETPKTTNTNTQLKDDKTKTAQQPEVAKVPLTSTNPRIQRDAPNPVEQSKLVPSGSISGKPVAPSSQAREPVQTKSSDNLNIRRPAPVDQILKQKTNINAKPAAEIKPEENANKKV